MLIIALAIVKVIRTPAVMYQHVHRPVALLLALLTITLRIVRRLQILFTSQYIDKNICLCRNVQHFLFSEAAAVLPLAQLNEPFLRWSLLSPLPPCCAASSRKGRKI
jgi:hypothetical protein